MPVWVALRSVPLGISAPSDLGRGVNGLGLVNRNNVSGNTYNCGTELHAADLTVCDVERQKRASRKREAS